MFSSVPEASPVTGCASVSLSPRSAPWQVRGQSPPPAGARGFVALLATSVALLGTACQPSAPPRAALPSDGSPTAEPPAKPETGMCREGTRALKVLGINDFHGQISEGRTLDGRAVGGAAVLASYLKAATRGFEDRWLLIHAGDFVGASPAGSALLQDEPSIQFLNLLANDECRGQPHRSELNPRAHRAAENVTRCNVVGTLGNHEFDEGVPELLRLLNGGNYAKGPFLRDPYPGARFPYVSANVIDQSAERSLLPPHLIVELAGVRVGVIGAVLQDTPAHVMAGATQGLRFVDEADAINRSVAALVRQGVHAILVSIHQGTSEAAYEGPTQSDAPVGEPIASIVARLDPEVDLVISGHAHAFTNGFAPARGGKRVLVTQALSAGMAFANIDVTVDCATQDVARASARIVTTFADEAPGAGPDLVVAALVAEAETRTRAQTARVIAHANNAVLRAPNAAGESALGDLIADSQREATHTDVACMNLGGIRADLSAGAVNWGQLFAVQPFGNDLVVLELTGNELLELLNQGLTADDPEPTQVSGLRYVWDPRRPIDQRIRDVSVAGQALDSVQSYRVSMNRFMALRFTAARSDALGEAPPADTFATRGPGDVDALANYLQKLPQPFDAVLDGRIQRAAE